MDEPDRRAECVCCRRHDVGCVAAPQVIVDVAEDAPRGDVGTRARVWATEGRHAPAVATRCCSASHIKVAAGDQQAPVWTAIPAEGKGAISGVGQHQRREIERPDHDVEGVGWERRVATRIARGVAGGRIAATRIAAQAGVPGVPHIGRRLHPIKDAANRVERAAPHVWERCVRS